MDINGQFIVNMYLCINNYRLYVYNIMESVKQPSEMVITSV